MSKDTKVAIPPKRTIWDATVGDVLLARQAHEAEVERQKLQKIALSPDAIARLKKAGYL